MADKPIVRTKVIRRTIHVTKHAKPKHPPAAAAPAGLRQLAGGSYGSATTGASSAGSRLLVLRPLRRSRREQRRLLGADGSGRHAGSAGRPHQRRQQSGDHAAGSSGGGDGGGTPVTTARAAPAAAAVAAERPVSTGSSGPAAVAAVARSSTRAAVAVAAMTEPRRSRRPRASLVFWGSIAPLRGALRPPHLPLRRPNSRRRQPTARAVQVRKVIKRRVVTTIVPSPGPEHRQQRPRQQLLLLLRRRTGGDRRLLHERTRPHLRRDGQPRAAADRRARAGHGAGRGGRRAGRGASSKTSTRRSPASSPSSELCALNADPRERVPASELLRRAVEAGVCAAERSGGLVDPTLVGEIEGAGYVASRAGMAGLPLGEALPRRRRAGRRSPQPGAALARLRGRRRGGGDRPPARACASTPAAPARASPPTCVAASLRGYSRFIVDCGGDIRIGGADALVHPYEVFVEHPITGDRAHVLRLGSGGVATSGHQRADLARRRRPLRAPPARPGDAASRPGPAWSAPPRSATPPLEAETLSKAALLSGPEGGRELLAERGGLLVHDSGRVELVGPLAVAPRIRLPGGERDERRRD